MKTILKSLVLGLASGTLAHAQVSPAATGGPGQLQVNSNLQYAVRYSQDVQSSNVYQTIQTSTTSGSLTYSSRNARSPFHADYAGGYTWTLAGPSYDSGLFQRLLLRKEFVGPKTKFLLSDDVSYVPQTPILGFSGVPGTGEPIGTPNPDPSTGQTILTVNTHVVNNTAMGRLEQTINYATTLSARINSEVLRYTDANGLDTNTLQADAELARRITARNSLYTNYSYSRFGFVDSSISIDTNTVTAGFRRKWTRNLSTEAGAGPEWIASTNTTVVPTTANFAADAILLYQRRDTSISTNYTHGTNGGSGYLIGGEVDAVQATLSRNFGQNLAVGFAGGFERTSGLNNSSNGTDASFGGAQSTWRVGRSMILFANYSVTNQGVSGSLPINVQNELQQIVGFGFGFSPREAHSRQ